MIESYQELLSRVELTLTDITDMASSLEQFDRNWGEVQQNITQAKLLMETTVDLIRAEIRSGG